MKKVIDGLLYNTETAEELGSFDNGLGMTDFNHMSESLYRTKKGRFFLAGEGGPMSKYSRSCGQNSWSGGLGINALTKEEAREWCERYLDADEYAVIFGTEEA